MKNQCVKDGLAIIIFSYNRSLQLEFCIRSLRDNLVCDRYQLFVIYHTSGASHAAGYAALRCQYSNNSNIYFIERGVAPPWWREVLPKLWRVRNAYRWLKYDYLRSQRDNFKLLVERAIEHSGAGYVMFSTDDEVMYRRQEIGTEIYRLIAKDPRQISFRCYVGGNHSDAPAGLREDGNFLTWNYYDVSMHRHWAYPFAVDGTVYDAEAILSVLRPTIYHMPTTLEAFVVSNVRAKRLFAIGYSPKCSSMVAIMLNRVQRMAKNRAGAFAVDDLNRLFLDGFRLYLPLTEVSTNGIVPEKILARRGDEAIWLLPGESVSL